MAGYIGGKVAVSAPQQIETKHTITATASQTSIPNVGYTVGAVHVYQNGIRLVDGTDYTATNGSTVTLETGATEGDQIVIVSHGSFETSDTVSKASGGTFSAGITVNGAVNATSLVVPDGSIPLVDLDIDGGTDIGAALVDADLMVVDDGAGGTNRKATMSRLATYMGTKGLGPAYTRSATVPSSPNAGDWWFNTSYGLLYIYDATDGWITNQDRTLGKGLLVSSGTYSLIVKTGGNIYTARFEPEDKMLADPSSSTPTHTYTDTNQSGAAAVSNATRGVFTQNSGQTSNAYGYVTIATRGAASDFGDSVEVLDNAVGCDHATRGVFLQNKSSGSHGEDMEYITIATAGNGTNFGDLSVNRWYMGNHAIANTTRGVWTGGYNSSSYSQNVMDYITIASTGNATDFGNLTVAGWRTETAHSIVRGLIFGGNNRTNTIDYITIASTGNATDFGDHLNSNNPTYSFSIHNKTYAYYSKASLNDREKHTIATAANATSFAWTSLSSLGDGHQQDAIKGWISASG